jgi:hypothetical protein
MASLLGDADRVTSRTIFAVWPLSLEPRRLGLAGVVRPPNLPRRPAA